jgi:alpha-tubulin suppressor-like RCC1 family protein
VGAINSLGELFTWGQGFYGQLGHGDNQTIGLPKKVDMAEIKFEKIKCGTYFTLSIDKRDMVYIWGKSMMNLSLDKNKLRPEIVYH